jgi:tetratricopeptide (TPR) repeat protein
MERLRRALAYYHWAFEAEAEERALYYGKTIENLQRVLAQDKNRYLAFFYLAFAQDELGNYGRAIEANGEALKIRPQFAPARYNQAVSYVKLRQMDKAYETLNGLEPHHEAIANILEALPKDEEIQPLLKDSDWAEKVATLVERLKPRPGVEGS